MLKDKLFTALHVSDQTFIDGSLFYFFSDFDKIPSHLINFQSASFDHIVNE